MKTPKESAITEFWSLIKERSVKTIVSLGAKENADKVIIFINSFPNDRFLDSSQLKEFADDNFRFNVNGRKFSKWVENTVRKGEIAFYEQFLHFPQCFLKTWTADT